MLSPKTFRDLLIWILAAIALCFSYRFGAAFFNYHLLQDSAEAKIVRWELMEIGDRFALKADYRFLAQEKNWQGSFVFSQSEYLNEMAALSALKTLAKGAWTAWYRSNNPSISALEKRFPKGLLIRTLVCYGVLIYFFYLRRCGKFSN